MKKRLLAILMSLILVMQVFPAVVFAGDGTGGTFNVALYIEKCSDVKYLEQDTYEISFGVQSDTIAIKGPQSISFVVDLTVFDLLYNDGATEDSKGNKLVDRFIGTQYKNAYDEAEDIDTVYSSAKNWNTSAYYAISDDGKIAYVCVQPAREKGSSTITTELRLGSILVGLKEGKTEADIKVSSVRLMTAAEAKPLHQDVVMLGDGNNSYVFGSITDGVEDSAAIATPVVDTSDILADTPVISVQPQGASYIQNATATALSVTASVTDGGTLSYQWYKSSTNTTTGGDAVGTDSTYTPSTAAVGTLYYYVVVTNTNENVSGVKTASVTSSAVAVTVSEDPDLADLNTALSNIASITYSMDQKDVSSEDSIKTYITEILTAESETPYLPSGVTVSSINKSNYTPAVAGTSADADGTDGSYVFTVTLTKNSKSVTTTTPDTVTINATEYTGITDVQAVAAAKAGIIGGEVNVDFGATADDKKTAAQIYVTAELAKITDAAGVTASVALKENTTYTVTFSKGSVSDTNDIEMTFNEAPDPNIKVADDAKTAAEGASYQGMKQADATSEDVIKTALKSTADTAINNQNVTVEIIKTDYTEAVAGTSATPAGTNGTFKFKVKVTAGAETRETAEKSITINATVFDGVTDAQAVALAKTAVEGIEWNDIAQSEANTEDAVKTLIENKVKTAVANESIKVTVDVTSFTAAVAGSAATTHEGTKGAFKFSVKVEKGAESATPVSEKELGITATRYEGILDSAAVAAAKDAVVGGTVNVAFGADQEAKEKAVQAYVNGLIGGVADAAGVTATVTFVEGSSYVVEYSKNAEYDSETIEMTVNEAPDPDIAVIETAKTKLDAIPWSDIDEETLNTEALAKTFVETAVKTAIENNDIGVTATISAFTAAVAGSAATTNDGTNGSFTFTVKLSKGNQSYTTESPITINIVAKKFLGKTDAKAVADAKEAIEGISWGESITQATANTEAAVKSYIEGEIAKAVNAEDNVTVTVTITAQSFTAAVAGSAATTHEGTNGSFKFSVKVSREAQNATPITDKELGIVATYYNGVLDKDAVDLAKTAVEGMSWSNIAQADANTEDTVKAYIKDLVETAVDDDSVTVTVTITAQSFTAAVAGSAATTHEGTNGSFKFSVEVSREAESATPITDKELGITATRYEGILDSAAVAAAKDAVVGGTVNVAFGADQTAKTSAVQSYVNGLIGAVADAAGVTATVSYVSGNDYSVALEKNAAKDSKTITMTVNEAPDPDIAIIETAKGKLSAISWDDVDEETLNTEALAKTFVETAVKTAIENNDIGVTATISAFTAAKAGSAATTNDGTNGSFTFTVKLSKGNQSYTTESPITINIVAKKFLGKTDAKAVADAKEAIEGISWGESIAQATANTEAAVKSYIEGEIAKVVNADDNVTVTVTITAQSFTAAVAGSAATTHEGTNGSFKFSVKVSREAQNATAICEKELGIVATYYNGVLDSEAVAAAKSALTDKTIIVRHNATDAEKNQAVTDYLNSVATGTAAGVTVSVSSKSSNSYTIAFDKGSAHDTKVVTIIVEETPLTDLDSPTVLAYNNRVLSWSRVPYATCYKVYVTLYPNESGNVYEFTTLNNKLDISGKLTDGQKYSFTVKAIGDQVEYDDSVVSDESEPFTYTSRSFLEWSTWWIISVLNRNKNPDPVIDDEVTENKETEASEDTTTAEDNVIEWVNPFEDVAETDEFYEAVKFVNENGLYQGVTATKFAPFSTMTRAMFVTVLGRLAGIDTEMYVDVSFSDAEAGEWYSGYIGWAADNGIINGYGNGKFGVNDQVTIEQAATIIARYARFMGIDTSGAVLADYGDSAELSDWAVDDMAWITSSGIYNPEEGKIAAKVKAERQLVATMIYAFATLCEE